MNRAHTTHFSMFPDPAIKRILRGWNPEGGAAKHDVTLGDVRQAPTVLAGLGFLLIVALAARRITGAVLIGVLMVTAAGMVLGISQAPFALFSLPPDPSPICLMTEGVYRGKGFQVLGRIVYEWENGGWNEWHIVFSDGTSGWLSDAQLQYAISFWTDPGYVLPPSQEVTRGGGFTFGTVSYEVATITVASYKGVEGELPFPFYGKKDMYFADLRTATRAFGTIDYSDGAPMLYLGEWVEYEELQLKNIRQFEGWV